MNTIAVFGADGFIAKNLIIELLKNPENTILAFGNYIDKKSYFDQDNRVKIYSGNFLLKDDVANFMNQQDVDYVFHLVSTTVPASSANDPLNDLDTNVKSSINLFEICAQKKVKKVVFISSGGAVYGDIGNDKISEDQAVQPISPYGIGKVTIEHYLRFFKATKNLNYIVYRLGNPYGPHQKLFAKQGIVPIFMHKILSNEPVTIYGDGSMQRDYIYIDDVCKMIIGSFQSHNKFSEYNIGSGKGTSVNEILKSVEKVTKKKANIVSQETPASFVQISVLDTTRFTNEFNIRPSVGLDEGLKEMLSYVSAEEQK